MEKISKRTNIVDTGRSEDMEQYARHIISWAKVCKNERYLRAIYKACQNLTE